MHSCRPVSQLLSQRLDEALGLLDQLKLRLHLSLCGNCRNVADQLDAVHAVGANLFAGTADPHEEDGSAMPTRRTE